jgi:hypothetical protein
MMGWEFCALSPKLEMHWDSLDEDISVAGLLAGQGDLTHPGNIAA